MTHCQDLMGAALDAILGPHATNFEVVELLFATLFGTQASEPVLAYLVSLIDDGPFTQASLAQSLPTTRST